MIDGELDIFQSETVGTLEPCPDCGTNLHKVGSDREWFCFNCKNKIHDERVKA